MYQRLWRSLLVLFFVPTFIAFGEGIVTPARGADCGTGVGRCRCGDTVTRDTVLSAKDPVLQVRCPCDGLVVAASVKKLVIAGTIRAQPDNVCAGIRLKPGVTDAVVTQGRIEEFAVAVDATAGVTGTEFSRLQIFYTSMFGIRLVGDRNAVEGNSVRGGIKASGDRAGIHALGDQNVVRGNKILDIDGGRRVIVTDGLRNIVSGNTSQGGYGFEFFGDTAMVEVNKAMDAQYAFSAFDTGHILTRNHAVGADQAGFTLIGDDFTVTQNLASEAGFGFEVEGTGHTVTLNHATRSVFEGFSVKGTNHTFTRNRADNNAADGFFLNSTGGSEFAQNLSTNNGGYGFQVDDRGSMFTRNRCAGNALGDSNRPNVCD